ncbi:DUF7742 family protein [Ruegeria hyattellae]|uniref:DUF7742 family protein n=1 Tax=Ruegeria hyattellae TaxID=3233337 RepID=UPI00355BE694
MLPVLHGDVSNAARALLTVAPGARRWVGARLVAEAAEAAAHVARTGRLHPRFGNGSLMAAARKRRLADEPGFDDPDYCACLIEVLRAVMHHRGAKCAM